MFRSGVAHGQLFLGWRERRVGGRTGHFAAGHGQQLGCQAVSAFQLDSFGQLFAGRLIVAQELIVITAEEVSVRLGRVFINKSDQMLHLDYIVVATIELFVVFHDETPLAAI